MQSYVKYKYLTDINLDALIENINDKYDISMDDKEHIEVDYEVGECTLLARGKMYNQVEFKTIPSGDRDVPDDVEIESEGYLFKGEVLAIVDDKTVEQKKLDYDHYFD